MVRKYNLQNWDKYWRLTITWEREYRWRNIYEKCICECWNEKWIPRWNITSGMTKSCWCLSKETCRKIQAKYFTKHWLSTSRIYLIYKGIKSRVENKRNISYKYYWGKGIRCLWGSFEEFYKDMWESYIEHVNQFWEKQTTIDRINSNWDYCKENCKRSTWKEQMHNRDIVYEFNHMRIKDGKKKSD